MRNGRFAFFPLLIAGLLWSPALGQSSDANGGSKPPQTKGAKGKKKDKKEKKDFPDFKEVVTDEFKPIDLVHKPDPGAQPYHKLYYNDKTDTLLATIDNSQLKKDFLVSSSISKAPGVAGWMWGDQVVRWERRDKQLLLIAPDVRNEGKEGTEVSDAVRRTYPDRIIENIKIQTLDNGSPVIDLGDLFKKDFASIGRVFGGALDHNLSKWTKIKCFQNNVVLTVESPFKGAQGRGGFSFFGGGATDGTLIGVNYNLSSMPETGYKPRHADDRIGYFTTVQRNWKKDYKAKTLFDRLVNRWHLEKQDPSLDKSPVKNPIIFYVEKTVPIRFRNAVKEGILDWNKAFEKCGFLDAMQVRQQTATNEFKDIDPEDVNYNFFRWTTTGVGIAVGPSRANPLTGQIYDADIVFDDGWIRGPIETHAIFGPKGLASLLNDSKLAAFLNAHPEFAVSSRQERLLPGYGDDVTETGELKPDYRMLDDRYRRYMCDYGASTRHELHLARTVFASMGYDEVPEEFLQQLVKEVVMHEVGHTLGLRHNFKASSWLPLEEVLSPTTQIRPFGGSVMDYNAFMFNEKKETQGDFAMRTIGPYDEWAIVYGYSPVKEPYKNEEELLDAITNRVAEAGLDYATDEDTGIFDPDPLVNRRDMGSDPLEYAKYRIGLVERLFEDMPEWAVDDEESYSVLRNRFDRTLFEIANSSIYAGRFVGGQYFHRDHKGDPNARPPFVMVSAEKQREAMNFLADRVLSAKLFQFDPQLLNKLAPGRWGHWGSNDYDSWLEYNLHDRVEMILRTALLPLFNPFTITRLHEMELRYDEAEPYTLAEHIRSLTNTVWSELDQSTSGPFSDDNPFVNSFRRGLQRAYTQQLVYFLTRPPGNLVPPDASALIRMTSEQLHDEIAKLTGSKTIDDASRAHLLDVQRRMRKALDAQQMQY